MRPLRCRMCAPVAPAPPLALTSVHRLQLSLSRSLLGLRVTRLSLQVARACLSAAASWATASAKSLHVAYSVCAKRPASKRSNASCVTTTRCGGGGIVRRGGGDAAPCKWRRLRVCIMPPFGRCLSIAEGTRAWAGATCASPCTATLLSPSLKPSTISKIDVTIIPVISTPKMARRIRSLVSAESVRSSSKRSRSQSPQLSSSPVVLLSLLP